MTTPDALVGFEYGRPVILLANGEFEFNLHAQRADGDIIIRVPAFTNVTWPSSDFPPFSGINRVYVYAGAPFDRLPVGTRLRFTIASTVDDPRLPAVSDAKTLLYFQLAEAAPLLFVASDDGVTITPGDGLSLETNEPWFQVTLTKTGTAAWAASGDFAPA